MKVKKAIIPAAGLGTRFLPATKAMPKEMLPIIDKPAIQYIVEEAVQSGIEDIIIVTGKGKRAIEDHFDHAFELEKNLIEHNKLDVLNEVQQSSMVDIHYIRQKEPKGLGHAIWCARKFIGDEPFAILLGDDLVDSPVPCLRQLMNVYEQTHSSVIGVQRVPDHQVSRYGVVDPRYLDSRLYQVTDLVEKPSLDLAPSNLVIMGRYILTPRIFHYLDRQEKGLGGEIQLTDAIRKLTEEELVYAYNFEGDRYDIGDKLGYVKTLIEFALKRDDMRSELVEYLNSLPIMR